MIRGLLSMRPLNERTSFRRLLPSFLRLIPAGAFSPRIPSNQHYTQAYGHRANNTQNPRSVAPPPSRALVAGSTMH